MKFKYLILLSMLLIAGTAESVLAESANHVGHSKAQRRVLHATQNSVFQCAPKLPGKSPMQVSHSKSGRRALQTQACQIMVKCKDEIHQSKNNLRVAAHKNQRQKLQQKNLRRSSCQYLLHPVTAQ